jgi:hypothetical protein
LDFPVESRKKVLEKQTSWTDVFRIRPSQLLFRTGNNRMSTGLASSVFTFPEGPRQKSSAIARVQKDKDLIRIVNKVINQHPKAMEIDAR